MLVLWHYLLMCGQSNPIWNVEFITRHILILAPRYVNDSASSKCPHLAHFHYRLYCWCAWHWFIFANSPILAAVLVHWEVFHCICWRLCDSGDYVQCYDQSHDNPIGTGASKQGALPSFSAFSCLLPWRTITVRVGSPVWLKKLLWIVLIESR